MNIMATINIIGDLVLDQSAGVQTGADGDDVAISVDAVTGDISGGLDAAFLTYLNGLTLSPEQLTFADTAEAASQVGLVTVTPAAGENVVELEFAPLTNVSSGLFTVDGDEIFLTTVQAGSAVEAWADGNLVAAFYIIPNADNTSATVQMITFEAIDHPLNPDPDDRLDFSDILKVRALVETSTPIGGDINVDDDGPSIEANGTVPTVVVDESNLNANGGPTDFSGIFTPQSGGADGTAAVAITYALDASGASGLTDTLTGQSVVLSTDSGVVYGKNGDGDTVFTISVDASGNVTLDQSRAVVHPTNDPNESVFMSSANLVTLTAIITDGDGDTAQAVAYIG
ncbi:MAG: hypothetical protein E5V59_15150, partial [Mesorhizobium sp.]